MKQFIINLISKEGYSSKKFAGLFLIASSVVLSLLLLLASITAIHVTLVATLMSGGLACFGVDHFNKKLYVEKDKGNSNSSITSPDNMGSSKEA